MTMTTTTMTDAATPLQKRNRVEGSGTTGLRLLGRFAMNK
jgi:hypothetical protein